MRGVKDKSSFFFFTTLLVCFLLFFWIDESVCQNAPRRCYNFPEIDPLNDCFIDPGGAPGTCTSGSPCASFQQAIDANCFNVVVSPGLYNGPENRGLIAGNLSHIRVDGPAGSAIVDLELQGRFITFGTLNRTEISIVNMTIMNGYFIQNTTVAGGGAILINQRPFTFTNLQFINNTIESIPSPIADRTTRGGAFIATGGSKDRASVCGCTFVDNRVIAELGEFGRGGAFTNFGYNMLVWGSAFRNNSVFSDNIATGGAIHHNGITGLNADISVQHCNFCNNSAIHGGGALYLVNTPDSVISSNVFLRNSALNGIIIVPEEAFGGAIQDDTVQGSSTYINNTYKGNQAHGPNSGGAISYRNAFDSTTSGGEKFCNNTASIASAIFTDDDIAYDLAPSQFQCNGPEVNAIETGNCTGGCVFLPNDGSCSLCALSNFTCEAILVLPPPPPAVCILSFF